MNKRHVITLSLTVILSILIPALAHVTGRMVHSKREKVLEKERNHLKYEFGKQEMNYVILQRKKRDLKTDANSRKKLQVIQEKLKKVLQKKEQIEQQEETLKDKIESLRQWEALKFLLIYLIVGLASILLAWFFPTTPLRWGAYAGGVFSILQGLRAYGTKAPDWAYVFALVSILALILFIGHGLSRKPD